MIGFLKKIFKNKEPQENNKKIPDVISGTLPVHIAIIMDGNGRWAKRRRLPRTAGHRAGMESLKRVIKSCTKWGIKYLTVYAFSTENWKRPQDEIDGLMNLLVEYISKELNEMHQNGVRVRAIGNIEALAQTARQSLEKAEKTTANNDKIYLQIAINYGGRNEIVNMVKSVLDDVSQGIISSECIDEKLIAQYLYTSGIPDPDLLIRPSGELRLSNFLLWQSAYAELVFDNILWPDYSEQDLYRAICAFQKRSRRFGAVSD